MTKLILPIPTITIEEELKAQYVKGRARGQEDQFWWDHQLCPKCGEKWGGITTVGTLRLPGKPFVDCNYATCRDCEYTFRVVEGISPDTWKYRKIDSGEWAELTA